MAKREEFYRFGRYCPIDCKENCCIICSHAAGAIEFIPTKPVISCRHKEVEKHPEYRKNEGKDCPCFSNGVGRLKKGQEV